MFGWMLIGALLISGFKDLARALAAAISCVLSLLETNNEKQ